MKWNLTNLITTHSKLHLKNDVIHAIDDLALVCAKIIQVDVFNNQGGIIFISLLQMNTVLEVAMYDLVETHTNQHINFVVSILKLGPFDPVSEPTKSEGISRVQVAGQANILTWTGKDLKATLWKEIKMPSMFIQNTKISTYDLIIIKLVFAIRKCTKLLFKEIIYLDFSAIVIQVKAVVFLCATVQDHLTLFKLNSALSYLNINIKSVFTQSSF